MRSIACAAPKTSLFLSPCIWCSLRSLSCSGSLFLAQKSCCLCLWVCSSFVTLSHTHDHLLLHPTHSSFSLCSQRYVKVLPSNGSLILPSRNHVTHFSVHRSLCCTSLPDPGPWGLTRPFSNALPTQHPSRCLLYSILPDCFSVSFSYWVATTELGLLYSIKFSSVSPRHGTVFDTNGVLRSHRMSWKLQMKQQIGWP